MKWICANPSCNGGLSAFSADDRTCPDCGADERSGLVHAETVMHWQRPHARWKDRGEEVRACDGGPLADLVAAKRQKELWLTRGIVSTPQWSSTNTPTSVTCPACLKLPDFAAALAATHKPTPALRD